MTKEPLGALTPHEMDELRKTYNAGLNEDPARGEKFYYVYGPDTIVHHGYHSKLAFLPNVYYFRNYFHALAHMYRAQQRKEEWYRDGNFSTFDYPDIAPKTKRR